MTRDRFEAEVIPAGRPLIIRQFVSDWPAVQAARHSTAALVDHLKARSGTASFDAWFGAPEIEGRFFYSDDLRGFNHERRTLQLSDLLDYVLEYGADPDAHTAYAGGIPIEKVLPRLRPQLPMPLLEGRQELLISLWFGSRTRTAAHWDVPQNLACVVAGRRRFILFPTEQVANLYVGPLDFTLAGQSISLVDFAAPDLERFPKFRHAAAAALVADLEPGDALYVPSLWWHHVESPDPLGAMINFWWRDGPSYLVTPLFTLFHSLLTLRDLPRQEREAWKKLFDHYIFAPQGNPLEHVPAEARGLFGEMTPEHLRTLKRFLAGPLA